MGGKRPAGARLTLFDAYTRYSNKQAEAATEKYVQLAKQYDISATQMALAYVNSRPFTGANIVGATNVAQLQENISSINIQLTDEVITAIENIHQEIPNPSP